MQLHLEKLSRNLAYALLWSCNGMASSSMEATELLEQLRQIIAPPTKPVGMFQTFRQGNQHFLPCYLVQIIYLNSPNIFRRHSIERTSRWPKSSQRFTRTKEQIARFKTNLIGRIVLRLGSKPMKAEDLQTFLHKFWRLEHQWRMTLLARGFVINGNKTSIHMTGKCKRLEVIRLCGLSMRNEIWF